jgi:hypothetical protein
MHALIAYMHALIAYMYANIVFSDYLTCARYKQTFEYVMEHAPYLGELISKKKKREELKQLITEVCKSPYT